MMSRGAVLWTERAREDGNENFYKIKYEAENIVLGVGGKAELLDENGNLPDIQKPFLVDSVAMVGGSAMGMTTVTAYIESASGVEVGGRSGLTAAS
ncbi:hypothetical protein BK127_13465 [Paenibacillus sp. FSL H7-0331]|nr:hypothetical protein BK127_13465 [Paenibacillus sp. FSL H7-0331]